MCSLQYLNSIPAVHLSVEAISMASFPYSIKRHHLLSPSWLSFCLLLLILYFVIPRVNIHAPADSSPAKSKNSTIHYYPGNDPSQRAALSATEDDASLETGKYPFLMALKTANNKSGPCGGRYIYIHDLPPKFNEAIVEDCENLYKYINMCRYMENNGLGHEMDNSLGVFSESGWYDTDQFSLEPIFYHRMKQYDCLTLDSSLAAAVYVPFYAGCDISRHFFDYSSRVKDELSYELVKWLKSTPEWKIMGGKDHFMVGGRVAWEFRRLTNNDSDWGDQLLLLPEVKNMSTLLIESSPYHSNDFAIPYPTYFHPSKDEEMISWQDRVGRQKREWLFSFAGAPRPKDPRSVRSSIVHQCKHSRVCKLLECAVGEDKICRSPASVMQLFESSHFCLQPQGDSPTRRSTFDAILAGCIPVFFHPASAYVQYTWHLPKNYSKYSVFISEDEIRKKNVSIEEILGQISTQPIEEMRAEVIDLIPRIVYADPRSKLWTFKDAVDVAVEAVIHKVTKLRRAIIHGRSHENFREEFSWKYSLFDDEDNDWRPEKIGPHEWDSFF